MTKTAAPAAPTTLTDPKTGRQYQPCGVAIEGKPCLRYIGHGDKRGGHRPSLERPIDADKAARRDAWKAMSDDEKAAELARRAAVTAAKKADKAKASKASKPRDAKTHDELKARANGPAHGPAKRQARVMGSGAVPRA
jgi:hypothetical protein